MVFKEKENRKVVMEGVRIIFRNFAGKEGPYNREGDRSFAVLLDDDVAEGLEKEGYNIKWLKPREDDEEGVRQAYLSVSVGYKKGRPPLIVMITSRGRNNLDEDTVEMLDWADISNVDLIINPYDWNVRGATGIRPYVSSMYVTIEEDELARKYAEVANADKRHL
jgi:hypothetical protein